MNENLPCSWKEEKFKWVSNVVINVSTNERIVIVTPSNPICDTCDNFRKCAYKIISLTVEIEDTDNNLKVFH